MLYMNPNDWLRDGLADGIKLYWGETGLAWLADLPEFIDKLVAELGLTELIPVETTNLHWIGHASLQGQPVTLKLGVPDGDFSREIQSLKCLQSDPQMVSLLQADAQAGWLLMARLQPGYSLKTLPEPEAMEVWLSSLHFMPVQAAEAERFPDARQWTLALFEPVPDWLQPAVNQARIVCNRLLADEPRQFLLHGDLHHDNLIFDAQLGWTRIDPKGVLAGPEFELGAMLRNPYPELSHDKALAERMHFRLQRLSADLRFDPARTRAWAFVQAVLAACWSLPDEPAARIWLKLAEALPQGF